MAREFWIQIGHECDDIVWHAPISDTNAIHVIDFETYEIVSSQRDSYKIINENLEERLKNAESERDKADWRAKVDGVRATAMAGNMNLNDFLKQLEELDKNASPSPWKYDCGNSEIETEGDRFGICTTNGLDSLFEYRTRHGGRSPNYPHYYMSNMELITQTRNALGTLIKIIRIQSEALNHCDIDWTPIARETKAEIDQLLNKTVGDDEC